jgi:hypothetical protein
MRGFDGVVMLLQCGANPDRPAFGIISQTDFKLNGFRSNLVFGSNHAYPKMRFAAL